MRLASLAALLGIALPQAAPASDTTTSWRDQLSFTASDRARFELVDWFRPPGGAGPGGANDYAFFANQLRLGARATGAHWQAVFELQDTRILGLPDDANLPAPFGSLGPGALYFAHTRSRNQGETFVKQGYLTLRRSGLSASAGRMELRDGGETEPGDRTLGWLKRERIAERLVGPFGYTHVTRSFDAVKLGWDRPAWNATGFVARPTRGGFEVSANRQLDGVSLAGAALTARSLPIDAPVDLRAFYLYYADARNAPVMVDNRPLAARQQDDRRIEIHTAGGHALGVLDLGPGALDLLAWGALQAGDWGRLSHRGWAYALEAGYRLARLPAAPWLRVGWNRSSGDGNPGDSRHDTFFQILPTARVYARFPFFNLMNNDDVFAQLVLNPHPRVSLRADYHWLRLVEGDDLWYAGGGATNRKTFGFAGIPSSGRRDLAQLVDVGITTGPWWKLWLSVYYGHAFGGEVIGSVFSGQDADYFFSELTFRY